MISTNRQNLEPSNHDVYHNARMRQLVNPGSGDNARVGSESVDREVYLAMRRSNKVPTLPLSKRYRKCNICSSTYKVRSNRRKWWKIKGTSSTIDHHFIRYDDEVEFSYKCGSKVESIVSFFLMLFLLVVLFLTVFWILHYREGLQYQHSINRLFNWHPILMVSGFVTISGFSILLNKLRICMKPNYVNLLHALLTLSVIPLAVLGLICVMDSHNVSLPPIANFNSLHSWIGLATMVLYGFQIVFAFFSYFTHNTAEGSCCNAPTSVARLHKLMEIFIFTLATITCITGLSERILRDDDSVDWSCEKIYKNCLGIVILVTALVLILFITFSKS